MEASGDLIGVVIEFTTRVQYRHDHLSRRHTLFMLLSRNATPIITDAYGFIGVNDNIDLVAVSGQRLIDRIINNFENHMVQACAVIGVTDVHARTLSYRIKALQDLNA